MLKLVARILLFSLLTYPLCLCARFQEGFYVGGALGADYLTGKQRFTARDSNNMNFPGALYNQSFHTSKFDYEFFGGYQMIFNNCFLLGLEPFVSYKLDEHTSYVDGFGASTGNLNRGQWFRIKRTWDFGAVVRLGYIFQEVWLIYALVGPELGYFKMDTNEFGTSLSSCASSSRFLWGIRGGIGIERSFNWINCGLDFCYTHFAPTTLSGTCLTGDPREPFENYSDYIKPRVLAVKFRVTIPIPIR